MATDRGTNVPLGTVEPDAAAAGVDRAFLYVELRDLPGLIQQVGAQPAAAALFKFGESVRKAVESYPGVEIKSEGDSYLCVCQSSTAAVGLAEAILGSSGRDDGPPLTVACGIVGGPGLSELDAYVQAAQLAATAPNGACLVTDAVRERATAAHDLRRARDVERASGSKDHLWLIETPSPIASVGSSASDRRMRTLLALGVGVVVFAVLATAAYALIKPNGAGVLPPGPWTIAAQLPLTGSRADIGQTLVNAVQLAVDDTNARGGIDGQRIALDVQDEGPFGDNYTPAATIEALVANTSVLAVVGTLQSPHAAVDIPITNAAGMLQCSPANSNPGLTKPRFGALDFRSANPDQINYVRLMSSDDIQGPAAASFVYHPGTAGVANAGIRNKAGLGLSQALVVDDTTESGRAAADSFESAFKALGGTTERRALNPGTSDFGTILSPLANTSTGPWAVYFGGDRDPGVELKEAMVAAGYSSVPLVSWDGLFDGSGSDPSYISFAGPAAANTYVTSASIAPAKADFSDHYREVYGADPNPYSAAAYACAQVALDAIQQAASAGVDAAGLRDAVRAQAVDPAHSFDTALGSVGFDANGDDRSQFVTLYSVDMGANNGVGDWVYLDEQDFGPAP